jgi:hypothetical protein
MTFGLNYKTNYEINNVKCVVSLLAEMYSEIKPLIVTFGINIILQN